MIITKLNSEEKIKWEPEIIKINEQNYIKKIELEKRGNSFCDIIFNNSGKEIFIGRYENESKNIKVLYKAGRILVYSDEFIKEKEKVQVTQVHTLYDIVDDVCYSMKEGELLNLFDSNIDQTYLKKNNKLVVRSDVEKKRRLKK